MFQKTADVVVDIYISKADHWQLKTDNYQQIKKLAFV